MGRIHLPELEDQGWFPATIRDAMTDWLSFMANLSAAPYRNLMPKIEAVMDATKSATLVELGAGGGGPSVMVTNILVASGRKDTRLVLTDLYPNITKMNLAKQAAKAPCEVIETPVDATSVPESIKGVRFLANAFHHLPEEAARACLADTVAKMQGIVIMEMVGRSPSGFAQVLIGTTLMLLGTPFVRPFRWSRLLFTYLIPVVPLAAIWDGIASCFRIYSPEELRRLVTSLGPNTYKWDIGTVQAGPGVSMTYLTGTPT